MATEPSSGHRVFISAKSEDYPFAREVHQYLASHGIDAFLSDVSLPALGDSDYRKVIDRELEAAEHLVLVTSSRANAESSWVEAEWGNFINGKRNGLKSGNLVTVLCGNLTVRELPASLRDFEAIPLTADALPRLIPYLQQGITARQYVPKPLSRKSLQLRRTFAASAMMILAAVGAWKLSSSSAGTDISNTGNTIEAQPMSASRKLFRHVSDNLMRVDTRLWFFENSLGLDQMHEKLAQLDDNSGPASIDRWLNASRSYNESRLARVRKLLRDEAFTPAAPDAMTLPEDAADLEDFHRSLQNVDDSTAGFLSHIEWALELIRMQGWQEADEKVYVALLEAKRGYHRSYARIAHVRGLRILRQLQTADPGIGERLPVFHASFPGKYFFDRSSEEEEISLLVKETEKFDSQVRELVDRWTKVQVTQFEDMKAETSLEVEPTDDAETVKRKAILNRMAGNIQTALETFGKLAKMQPTDEMDLKLYSSTAIAFTTQMQSFGAAGGLYVFAVMPSGGGEAAGLRVGDIMLQYAGLPLQFDDDLFSAMAASTSELSIPLRFLRRNSDDSFKEFITNVPPGKLGIGISPI